MSSLDPSGARQVRDLVRQMAEHGTAIVFSSHDMGEVEDLCTALTVLNAGRAVFSGTANELRARAPGSIVTIETSDDAAAVRMASRHQRLRVSSCRGCFASPDPLSAREGLREGLGLVGDVRTVDEFVIALGCAGIAIRRLERRARSLESLFLELTSGHTSTPRAVSECERNSLHMPEASIAS